MRVKSEVDNWVKIFGYSLIALLIYIAVAIVPGLDLVVGLSIVAALIIILLSFLLGTYYELRKDHLYCRCGFMTEKIPYKNIKYAILCENRTPSMALSCKRIEVRQHNNRRGPYLSDEDDRLLNITYISPKNREEFLEELLKRCDNTENR